MDMVKLLDFLYQLVHYMAIQVALTIICAYLVQAILRASINRVVRQAIRRHKYNTMLDEEKRQHTLSTIFRTATAVFVWITAIIVILWQLHINIGALMTGAGVVGIIIGFGAQNTIRDFLAGIFVIGENQYRVGDIVAMHLGSKEIAGVVEDITIRITRLRDLDGNLHIVQNGAPNAITNLSFEYANVNIDFGVAYGSDIDQVRKIMNDAGNAMAKDEDWAKHVYEPIQFLRVDGFDDSAIRIKALGKVEPAMQWDVAGQYRERIIKQFAKHGIEMPLPQRVIHTAKKS
jgi:small conductance mechanosensitive channel